MGRTRIDMIRSIALLIAIAAIAHSFPSPNDIVPETSGVKQTIVRHRSAVQAQTIVSEMLQSGSDWTACSELANTTRTEVRDDVQTKQDLLDNLDNDCACAELGQDEVNRTHTVMVTAQTRVETAKTSLEVATNADVQLESQEFQVLQQAECTWISADAAFLAAHSAHTLAVTEVAEAETEHTYTVQMHTEAVSEAARLKLECECHTSQEHERQWEDANSMNDEHDRAWAQAHHIECVIAQTSEADCHFGPAPTVSKPYVCPAVLEAVCSSDGTTPPPSEWAVNQSNAPTDASTSAPTEAPTDSPTDSPTEAPTDTPSPNPSPSPTPTPTPSPSPAGYGSGSGSGSGSTKAPTKSPTDSPTNAPTDSPTDSPGYGSGSGSGSKSTNVLTDSPTDSPTNAQTDDEEESGSADEGSDDESTGS